LEALLNKLNVSEEPKMSYADLIMNLVIKEAKKYKMQKKQASLFID
jgi:hypothetical protein